MNPLFLLLMAGGAVAAATAGRKKRGGDLLRCHEAFGAPGEPGQPGRFKGGGGPDIRLPSNVRVVLKNTNQGNACSHDEDADYEGYIEVSIAQGLMGSNGSNFRAVLERVVIPAAVMSPNIAFSVVTFRHQDSYIWGLAGDDDHPREVVRVWPDWGDGVVGAFNEPLATPMEIAQVFQYVLLRVKEAIVFSYVGNNGYHWMPSCGLLEGQLFMPMPMALGGTSKHTTAIQGSSLQEVLAYEGNSVWGYVDYLMLAKPSGQNWADASAKAHQYARKILTEMNPPCGLPGFGSKDDQWPPQLLLQYNYMAKRIHKWIEYEAGYSIPFKPEFGP